MNPKVQLFILLIITTILILFSTCEKLPIPDQSKLKAEIADLKKAASIKVKEVVYRDSIRDRVIVKWKRVRFDSLIPCEELIAHCDTMYLADSTLIASQRNLIGVYELVIDKQDSVIRIDSVTIQKLNKKPNRNKLFFAAGFILGVSTNLIK